MRLYNSIHTLANTHGVPGIRNGSSVRRQCIIITDKPSLGVYIAKCEFVNDFGVSAYRKGFSVPPSVP